MATYSFIDVQASIVGPGGAFSLGYGAGTADEGIDISMSGEKTSMTIGADGSGMHTLNADSSGKATIRLLKTSPVNQMLMAMYDAQSVSSALTGKNVLTLTQLASGDVISCRQGAFVKRPDLKYGKETAPVEWELNFIQTDGVLGTY